MRYINSKFLYGIISALVLLLSLISFSCNSNDDEAGKLNRLNFDIDSTKLAAEVKLNNYKLSFNPPVNLVHSDEFFNKLVSGIAQNDPNMNELVTKPIDAFVDNDFNVLVVSGIEPGLKDTAITGLSKITALVKKQFKSEKAKYAEFLKDDIKIGQFLIQDSINVIFKLLLENPDKKVLQFDYIIPQKNYKNEIKAIESSIGSIKYIK